MGNASALAYDIQDSIEYTNSAANWHVHKAVKQAEKDELREKVCIFRFNKSSVPAQVVSLAQRNVQRLKTLRHPNILAFVESAEMDDSIALITEPCVPCEVWLKQISLSGDGTQDSEEAQDIIWGFKCILQAVQFLHENGQLLHGNLGLHALFVTPGGDWKLGAFELASSMSITEDYEMFSKNHSSLDRSYWSPEREAIADQNAGGNARDILTGKIPPYYLDIYSLGRCLQKAFQLSKIEQPRSIGKYLSSMLHAEYRKRPTAQKLLQSAMFNSDHIRFHESIGELVLKSPKDFIESISAMDEKILGLSKAVCAHKILPNLNRAMQMAINDFPQRDARERCRQLTQTSISMLCKLAANNKVDEKVFQRTCVATIVQLWSMTDRTIRTTMLQSLKDLSPLIPNSIVNKNIFDNVLAGFSDSSAKLREGTLTSLIYIVDKLEETQFQDRLVRVVCNMQNDVEAPIRTNATIFIGKIAVKMREGVRARVLCNSLLKAMKDNFVHCRNERIAALKTAKSCLAMVDVGQIATKLLPQASVLCVDKSMDVRALALVLIESCLSSLRKYHEHTTQRIEDERKRQQSAGPKIADASSTTTESSAPTAQNCAELPSQKQQDSSWSSWSVLQGLSKTLESATISATTLAESPSVIPQAADENRPQAQSRRDDSDTSRIPVAPHSSGWEDDIADDDIAGDEDMDTDAGESALKEVIQEQEFSADISGQGWKDDSLDDLMNLDADDAVDEREMASMHSKGSTVSGTLQSPSILTLPKKATRSISDVSIESKDQLQSKAKKQVKAVKPVVKKLSSSKDDDNWDDF